MVCTGLVGALTRSSYKWGYFAFGTVAFLFVAWNVVFVARNYAKALGNDVHRIFLITGVWTISVCLLQVLSEVTV